MFGTDYKFSLRGLEGKSYEEELKECHTRSAFKLQRLCFANGGIYIKLGQHVAQLVCLIGSFDCVSVKDGSISSVNSGSTAAALQDCRVHIHTIRKWKIRCFAGLHIAG